jgi:hypothetical protein
MDRRSHILQQGFFAGLAGFVTVALVILILDVASGRGAFYTPALLGGAYFYNLTDPTLLRIWPGPVLAFNGLHLFLFLALGLVGAWLAEMAERGPHLWYVGLVLFLMVLFHVQGLVMGLGFRFHDLLSPWMLLFAGAAGAGAMAALLLRFHPTVRGQMQAGAA